MPTKEQRRLYEFNCYSGTFEKKIKKLIKLAKVRAREKGTGLSITPDDFRPVTHCPLLGIPLEFSKRGKGPCPNSPTIDRLDSSLGYVPGNVWVISHKANSIKRDSTLEELEMIAINLRKRLCCER